MSAALEKRGRGRPRKLPEAGIIVPKGKLRLALEAACKAARLKLCDLTVLSPDNDPFRFDTEAGHRNGQWFAEMVQATVGNIHVRGHHYRLIGNAMRPDGGGAYVNNDDCANFLDTAAKAARWLGYVDWDRIVDRKNDEPEVFVSEQEPCRASIEIPDFDLWSVPRLSSWTPRPALHLEQRQPYRIVLIGEKTSLSTVLRPIAREISGEMILFGGTASLTHIAGMVRRALADPRPTVCLYFSDFDPSGWNMATCVSRWLQAFRIIRPSLQIDLDPVALTKEQCEQFELPSTPLKRNQKTEKAVAAWKARWGREQTEIDALAALRPDDLRDIAWEAIAPFWDATLADRVEDARHAWLTEARDALKSTDRYGQACALIREAHERLSAAAKFADGVDGKIRELLDGVDLPALPDLPEALLPHDRPWPLFSSDDDFVTATLRLIERKRLGGEDSSEEGSG